jgi:ABC-type glycerol-3-phosphate transport system substrate-binding protein
MRVTMRLLALLLGLVLVACGSPNGEAGSDITTTTAEPAPTSTTALPPAPTTTTIGEIEMPHDHEVVEAARADLAQRNGVDLEAVSVVRARQVDWPDSALGCPEEGMAYTQAVVSGYQVILQVDGRVFDYHAGSDGEVFLCPSEERDGGYEFVPPPGIDQ